MKVWKYGDNINTDQLFPGKYTYTCSKPDEIKPHLLEDLDPDFAKQAKAGDVLFVGKNFGCGSSREQPALGLASIGITCVVGIGFARIFYRAAINQGLILVECKEAVDAFKNDSKVELELEEGKITIDGVLYTFPKLPAEILAIRNAGGLLKYTSQKLEAKKLQETENGPKGDTVKNDVNVKLTIVEDVDSGIFIHPESMDSELRPILEEGLEHFHIAAATVRVEVTTVDALLWVVAARFELAATELLGTPALSYHSPFLPKALKRIQHSAIDFSFPRSRIYMGGHAPRLLKNTGTTGADMISLDLEDAVPLIRKHTARIIVRNCLLFNTFGKSLKSVRINPLEEGGLDDLRALIPYAPVDCIVAPKIQTASDILLIEKFLSELLPSGSLSPRIMPIIESALGVENAFGICLAIPKERLAGIALGLEDYTADLGVKKTLEGTESAWACSRMINAAAAAETAMYDSVYANFRDTEGLKQSTLRGKQLGFKGKSCIHPSQVPVVNQIYSPTEEEIKKAQRIVEAFEKAQGAVISLDGKMIDVPVVKRAQNILLIQKKISQ